MDNVQKHNIYRRHKLLDLMYSITGLKAVYTSMWQVFKFNSYF
jgi:hypothetical protein